MSKPQYEPGRWDADTLSSAARWQRRDRECLDSPHCPHDHRRNTTWLRTDEAKQSCPDVSVPDRAAAAVVATPGSPGTRIGTPNTPENTPRPLLWVLFGGHVHSADVFIQRGAAGPGPCRRHTHRACGGGETRRDRAAPPHHRMEAQHSSGSESGDSPGSPASPGRPCGNAFANDGSFMELFKRKMEEERRRKEAGEGDGAEAAAQSSRDKKTISVTSFVGKRRGGARMALKTGVVAKKQKMDTETEPGKGDAWSKYMAEVKKYKAHQCGDDDKTRPLVK
ncbi:telomerase RNA component interacting RNase [Brachyhypopomus gauderio]|uniref:telomerase RNA component interacting RNase n=1 Tax=Brachyhypopomus gauderio TaxID=698409 RepID=UPI0040418616